MAEDPIIRIADSYKLHSFEEKVAENVTVCKSTNLPISIAYHTFGNKEHPLLMLVSAFSSQSVYFETPLCEWLAQHGYYVCRFDNRDIGKSTYLDDAEQHISSLIMVLPTAMAWGEIIPYKLDDMADDAVALMRHLGKSKAHWYGGSMGGMIAQLVGLNYPEAVETLTVFGTTSGNSSVGSPSLLTMLGFLKRPKSETKEDLIAFRRYFIDTYMLGSHPIAYSRLLEISCEEAFARGIDRRGAQRQLAAITRQAPRDERLSSMTQFPTLILHGKLDKLFPVAHANHLYKTIPWSQLHVFPQLGHYVDPTHIYEVYSSLLSFIQQHQSRPKAR